MPSSPSAFDNRPLKFEEVESKLNQMIFVSATPGEYERKNSTQVAQQVIRPTGLLDPLISVRPVEGQVTDLLGEINARIERHERVLVTTLTKKMAEDLTDYFTEQGIKVKNAQEAHEAIRPTNLSRRPASLASPLVWCLYSIITT